jgi:hypothetical protein
MHHRSLGDEEVYRICVGDDDSTRYYLDRFENFDLGGGPASWNWMAFWASFIWLVHRRLFWYDDGGIAWNCGYFQASERDTVYGTNIDAEYLPSESRARSP